MSMMEKKYLTTGKKKTLSMNQEVQDPKEKIESPATSEHYGALSGSRSGISDYNDGVAPEEQEEDFDGKIAYGNELSSSDTFGYDKYHSGL
jgi:hypothetical protein